MSNIFKKFRLFALLMVAVMASESCGGGSNNDNGTSVTFLTWNSVDEEGVCDPLLGIQAQFIPTSTLSDSSPGTIFTCATVRNNMCGQGIRLERAVIDYYVDGSNISIPSTTVAQAGVLGRAGNCVNGPTTSLPTGFTAVNERQISVNTVPAQILEYLALNREDLPEPPYNLNINVRLFGVTTSGQSIQTNSLNLQGVVTTNNPFNPGNNTGTSTDGLVDDGTIIGIDEVEGTDLGTDDTGIIPDDQLVEEDTDGIPS